MSWLRRFVIIFFALLLVAAALFTFCLESLKPRDQVRTTNHLSRPVRELKCYKRYHFGVNACGFWFAICPIPGRDI
jgi:hypothetical protein